MNGNDTIYFIDANVPMYAAGVQHPLKQPCTAILQAIAVGSIAARTDVEVVQEILHRYSALGQRDRAVRLAAAFVRTIPDPLPITVDDMLLALDVHLQHAGLQARDSIHVAVMQRNGLTHIITTDQQIGSVPGIIRHDPADWPFS